MCTGDVANDGIQLVVVQMAIACAGMMYMLCHHKHEGQALCTWDAALCWAQRVIMPNAVKTCQHAVTVITACCMLCCVYIVFNTECVMRMIYPMITFMFTYRGSVFSIMHVAAIWMSLPWRAWTTHLLCSAALSVVHVRQRKAACRTYKPSYVSCTRPAHGHALPSLPYEHDVHMAPLHMRVPY